MLKFIGIVMTIFVIGAMIILCIQAYRDGICHSFCTGQVYAGGEATKDFPTEPTSCLCSHEPDKFPYPNEKR